MPSPSPDRQTLAPVSPDQEAATIGVAVIGLGVIGRRMLEQAAQQPDLKIVGAWDIDVEACRRAHSDFPGVPIAASAESLAVQAGHPLLAVERVSYTYSDKPVEWRRGLYKTDRHFYRSELG